jgi:flagellar basal-body rod modification protein FlgD
MSGSVSSPAIANTGSASVITQAGTTALSSLNGNFNNFLSLLMTQLKNQDPSSPMDSNQFTTELVQFSSVEQQISTNTSLTQLIQLGQANQIEQSASMLGKPVTATSSQLTLQNGASDINFNTKTAQPVAIAVYNSWKWNGQAADGTTMPDGAYSVTVTSLGANGTTAQVPFTVTGTATSVQNNAGTVQVQMGGLTLPFSSVQSVGS